MKSQIPKSKLPLKQNYQLIYLLICKKLIYYPAKTTVSRSLNCGNYSNFSLIFLQDIATFARYIIQQFVTSAEKNPKIYMEILFWKSSKTCYELVEGYDKDDGGAAGKKAGKKSGKKAAKKAVELRQEPEDSDE